MRHLIILCWLLSLAVLHAAPMITENGEARAQIVIAAEAPRMVPLAAQELQTYVQKITGAELPIVSDLRDDLPTKLYVGESSFTKALGLSTDDLDYGAFRLVAGPDYLVLLGRDVDFEPKEPAVFNRGNQDKKQQAWEERSGSKTLIPMKLWKDYNKELGIWRYDEGGSFNAVCGFLRTLGVRWYMPGELGEVVPSQSTLAVPDLNETVRPDYPTRLWLISNFGGALSETILWEKRIGMTSSIETLGAGMLAHGMRNVQGHPEMQAKHPEYYALYGGERDTHFRGTGHACFTSAGLLKEAVDYARAFFDIYDQPTLQLSPQDGMRQCQCETCWGMPMSDYVFGFLDRVAREVYKTHPDRIILGAAYSSYRLPPASIDRFSPNVAVSVNNVGRPAFTNPERWEAYQKLVADWQSKLAPGHLLRVENNLYANSRKGPVRWPVIHPHQFAKDLRAMKGISMGERNEIPRGKNQVFTAPGSNHLNLYVNARFLWDADQDIEALLDEYYQRFYGPAAEQMKAAFEFSEKQGRDAGMAEQVRFGELLQTAREAAGDTIHSQRIQVLMDELAPLDELQAELKRQQELGDPRQQAPLITVRPIGTEDQPSYTMRDLKTGEEVDLETRFHFAWDEEHRSLIVNIRCEEPDMENLFISKDVWGGDSVAFLLETAAGTYYQIEVNPDGDLVDAGRKFGKVESRWSSRALAKAERGDDFWSVRLSIPIVPPAEGDGDPFNFVVGEQPTSEQPWYFNVGRIRIRDREKTAYAFMPTGRNYHAPEKFARLVINP